MVRRATIEDLVSIHFMGDFVHPSLVEMATELEFSIQRLQMSTEMLLNRYKSSAINHHYEIQNLGDAILQNYAMFASIGRASRAYCVGIRFSVYETLVAGCLIQAFSRNIRKMALDIKHKRNNLQYNTIAENTLKKYKKQSTPIPSVFHSGVMQKNC